MGDGTVRGFARKGLLGEVARIDAMQADGRRLQAMTAAENLVAKVRQYLLAEEQEEGVEDAVAFAAEAPTDRMQRLPAFEDA